MIYEDGNPGPGHVYLEGEQSMKTNIPHKLTTGKKKLPWVDDQLSLKLNKAKRLHTLGAFIATKTGFSLFLKSSGVYWGIKFST
jgi:hypothetical protein